MASANLIQLIKELRERTGAGMMDCKKALEENGLDIDKAGDYLREKGIAKAAKKADRIAAEGLADVKTCKGCGLTSIVEVNCETDFVSRGDAFHELVAETGKILRHEQPANLEAAKEVLKDLYTDATVKIGEKLDFRRFDLIQKQEGQTIGTYIHMGGKIAVAVVLDKENQELADNLAMQIAANNPKYITDKDIPAEEIEKETQIQLELMKNDPKLAGKPEQMLKNICKGKVSKVLFESVLSEQPYLLDDSKKIGQLLAENNAKILKFVRYGVGEGIEKRHEDFAAEVMAQSK